MKDYFRRIIDIFTSSPQDEATVGEVQRWLADRENEDKKNEALYSFWNRQKPDMSQSEIDNAIKGVYRKIGYDRPVSRTTDTRKVVSVIFRYAAAVVLLAVSAVSSWYMTRKEYSNIAMVENYTTAGERKTVELPDGTVVQVNSSTLLIYPEKFAGDTRTVFLQGEASFDVMKNERQPFIVRSGAVSVTALGTEFNVSAYSEDEDIKATLLEGKVKVMCGGEDGTSYILLPGEQVSYRRNTGTSHKESVNVEYEVAWVDGIMVFRSMTMEEITRALHRKYGVYFETDKDCSLYTDRYTFRFREDASIDEVLTIMKKVSGNFDYELSEQTCRIRILR